ERDVSNWGFFDWTAYAHVGREDRLADLWKVSMEVYFADSAIDEELMLEHAMKLARQTVTSYGYITYMNRRRWGYSVGGCAGWEGRAVWGQVFQEHAHRAILRDVHYRNFLSREYLELPIEGTTLASWIEEHSQGG